MTRPVITGIGSALGLEQITNKDIAEKIKAAGGGEITPEWIVEKTGIETRYSAEDDSTSWLALHAAKKCACMREMRPILH